jgi:hypothetical protein
MIKLFGLTALILTINCCSTRQITKQYKDKIIPILSTLKYDNETVALDDSSCSFIFLVQPGLIKIIDINKDSIIKIIELPKKLKNASNISVPNLNNFAICTDTSFWIYKDEKFYEESYSSDLNNARILSLQKFNISLCLIRYC